MPIGGYRARFLLDLLPTDRDLDAPPTRPRADQASVDGDVLAGEAVPEVGESDAQAGEEAAERRQGEADHRRGVAVDPVDEGSAEAVDRERTRDLERLARRDVGVDLLVADVG